MKHLPMPFESTILAEYLSLIYERKVDQQNKLIDRLSKNPEFELSWTAEDIFITSFVKNWASGWLNTIEERHDITIQVLIEELKTIVSRPYNVRESSSNAISSEASTWKFVTQMELLAELQSVAKYVK